MYFLKDYKSQLLSLLSEELSSQILELQFQRSLTSLVVDIFHLTSCNALR
jgi:hypothetical protein